MRRFPEYTRKLLHISVGLCALLLRWLTWWQAAIGASAAVLFNLVIFPRIGGKRLWREGEHARGYPLGILIYPISVLLLILLFHDRLHLAAAMWGLLAAGDGMASIIGTAIGASGRLPWNRKKSWAGSAAFLLFGGGAGIGLAGWAAAGVAGRDWTAFLWAFTVVAFLSTVVESLDSPIDDNVSIPIGGGLLLFLLLLVSRERWLEFVSGDLWTNLAWALGLNLLCVALATAAGTLSRSGALGAFGVGGMTFVFGGWRSFVVFASFFVLGSAATRVGYARKLEAGLAQEREGRRSMRHVLANGGIVPLLALLAALSPHRELFLMGLVGAMATAAADTVSSEIGKLIGRRTFLITTLRPAPPGTTGAVSLEGTLAGVLASLIIGVIGWGVGLFGLGVIWIVVVAALIGTLTESYLGATLESRGHLNNELTNFLNTVAGGGAAMGLLGLSS